MTTNNADPNELARFERVAARWWDPRGARVLDVGCGGGLLCEGMAAAGAEVTGIDLGREALEVAELHLLESGLQVDYQLASAESFAGTDPEPFDVVTCLELLEHVPDPASVVNACAALVKPGGRLFFSTINRNPKSFLMAIVGAEYLLNLVPRGTHEYRKLIRPSELAGWLRAANLELRDLTGLHYNPLTERYFLGGNVDVNYFAYCTRPGFQ